MKVAINKSLIDKSPPNTPIAQNGFKNLDLNATQFAEEINKGFAFCPNLNGPRKSDNFLCSG